LSFFILQYDGRKIINAAKFAHTDAVPPSDADLMIDDAELDLNWIFYDNRFRRWQPKSMNDEPEECMNLALF
jgi:hypothetical protein